MKPLQYPAMSDEVRSPVESSQRVVADGELLTLDYRRPIFSERLGPSRRLVVSLATYAVAMIAIIPCVGVLLNHVRLLGPTIQLTVTLSFALAAMIAQTQRVDVFADEVLIRTFLKSRRIPRDHIQQITQDTWPLSAWLGQRKGTVSGVKLRLRSREIVALRSHRTERLAAVLRRQPLHVEAIGPLPSQTLSSDASLPFDERPRADNRLRRLVLPSTGILTTYLTAILTAPLWNDKPLTSPQHLALLCLEIIFVAMWFINRSHYVRTHVDARGLRVQSLLLTRTLRPDELESASLGTHPKSSLMNANVRATNDTEHFDAGAESYVKVLVHNGQSIIIDSNRPEELLAAILTMSGAACLAGTV